MATLTKSILPISGYTNQYYTYQCVVTENSYNMADNTSNVTVTFSIKGPWAPSYYDWPTSYGIVVDGVVKKTGSSSPYVSTSYVQLITWTGNITHNSDGSKAINVGVYLYNSGTANYLPKQYTSSSPLSMGSVTLTTIPRASTITYAANVTLGNKCNIQWTPSSTNFKYKIKLSLGDWVYNSDFISPSTTNLYKYEGYTIPRTSGILSQIYNSSTATMTATLTTYNSSGTQIGSASSKTFTVTVPSDIKPTISSISVSPNTGGRLVQNKNAVYIDVNAEAGLASDIKSYTFSGPGITGSMQTTSSKSFITNII